MISFKNAFSLNKRKWFFVGISTKKLMVTSGDSLQPIPALDIEVVFLIGCTRPPQNVDVLAGMDLEIPCSRRETPGCHPRSLLPKYEGQDEN